MRFGLSKKEVSGLLKSRGINPTSQRIEIATLLLQRPQHLSAEEIYQQLNQEFGLVSQATVYNTLRLLVERGVISEVLFSPDRIYYDSNTAPHHHFLDLDTGSITDLAPACAGPLNLCGLDIQVEGVSLLIKGRQKRESVPVPALNHSVPRQYGHSAG
ncbi:MAG: transcriptional repressor [Spirochaetales bacterium]|nr:transcriptional repressor [Spirochaetales bacterium]